MKNLKKLSRENLKTVKGGITPECTRDQAGATACFTSLATCEANAPFIPDVGNFCMHICNKYCY